MGGFLGLNKERLYTASCISSWTSENGTARKRPLNCQAVFLVKNIQVFKWIFRKLQRVQPDTFSSLLFLLTFFPFFLFCFSLFLAGVIFGLRGCLFSFIWLQLSAGMFSNLIKGEYSDDSFFSLVKLSTCCNTKAKAHTMVITTNLGQWRPTERKECDRIQSIKSSVPACFSFLLVAYLLRLSYFMRQPQSWF